MWNRLFRKKIKTTSSVRNDEETSSLSDFRQNSSTSSLRKKSLTLSKVINTLTLKSSNGKKNKNNKNYFRYIDDSNVAESSIFNSHYNYENDDDKIYSKTKNRREFGDFETSASSDDKTSSATLKPDPTSLPSDGIQGKPLDAAENASSAFEDTVPTSLELRSCPICTRTFVPVTLAKHVKICEKMAMKKRKKFDSFRQRREGTDLADFLPKNFGLPASKISSSTSVSKSTPAKVQQHVSSENLEKKKDEPTSTKLGPKSSNRKLVSPAGSTAALLKEKTRKTTKQLILNPPTEQCPFCERCFGAKAYDRHVEWCKEKRKITGSKNNATLSAAKERLEARTKYRAPCLKSKRAANREKYSGFGFSDDYDEGRMDMEPYSDKFLMSTSLTSSVTSEGDPSDKYDPFISAKRQLQELCSAPSQVNPTLPTPSSLSIGTTMGKSTDTTSSVFNEQQTPNNTSLQKSNFRRSASLRVTRKRTPPPSLTSTRPLFTPNALTYKSTIHRGLSDEGPISHSFLKPEEYDEMPVKSVCVNEYAITHSSRMTKRDSHPSVHQRHFKTTLNNNSANKITHNNNHLKSIEKTINPLSKTDSLKIFLKHEKETARDSTEEIASDLLGKENEDKNNILNELHRCSYRTHSANSNSNKNNNPHSSSIKNSEDNVTTSVPKEIEKYSNHRQNDIYHYPKSPNNNNNNNNTVATISTANKLHSIKLEPLPKIPSVKDLNSNKNTSTQTAMLQHHSTHHDPSISAHFSQSSSNIVNNSVISPLSSISFNPLHLPKSILNRVTPPPCVVSSNPSTTSIKLNLILDNPYKSGENDNSNNGSDRELIDSVEGGRSDLNLVSNDTSLPKIINETSRAAEEKPKQIQNSQNNNNYSDVCMPKLMQILQEEKEQNLFSSSSPVESDKTSKPAKRKTMRKRQISLGKNQFLYDMPSENEPSSEEYCGTTYSTDDVFHEQIVGNKGENNSNKPNNIMIPNLDDVNIEEFLNSFEGDEEQFSVFKDFKEFLLNHAVIHTTLLNKTNDFIDIFCSSTPNRSDKNDQNTKEIDLPHSDGNSDYDYIESDNEGNKNEIFISIETDKSDYPNPLTFESRSNPNSIKYTDVTNESMKSRERAFDNTNNEIFNKYETPDLYNKKITENNNIDNNVNINNTKNMMKTMQGEFDNYSHSFKQHPVEKMKNLQSGQEENCTEEDSQRYEDIDISPTANLSGSKTALPKAQWQNDSDEMNSSVENFPHQQNITRSKQSADSAYGSPVEVRSINRDSFGSIPPVMKACPASRSKRSQIYQKQKHNEVNLEIGQQLDDEHSYNHDYQNIQRSYHDIQQGHSRRSRNLSSSESETSLPQIQSQNNMKPNNYEMQIDFQDKDISDNSNKYKRRNSSQSEKREPRLFKFCHECGSEFLVIEAKFCTECGVKRIILE